MALPSTVHNIEVALSHVDRGVYEQLSLKAARHPSETEEYFLTRLLAYCLEFDEGISFSRGGVSDPDDPPLMIKDLAGGWMSWIEIGAPNAARLHQASKASPRVALYTHKEPRILMRGYEGQRIHKAEEVEIYAMDRDFLASLVDSLDRRIEWALSVTDSKLFLDVGGASYCGAVERLSL
jgi:uncharacterized protein YaeQ